MNKKAAIYIRTSSEEQSKEGKASPQEQEEDARKYIEKKGYDLVGVYPDTKRYRGNSGRLIEPTATRSDRPQLNRLLNDFDSEKIDVIVAWREDRLYRGANRAMVEVNERVKNGLIIELTQETYDPATAPVKAWAAGIELEAKRQRMMMGIRHKLKQGRVRAKSLPYGYQKNKNGFAELHPEESEWVRKIWSWYAEKIPVPEIRKRLIENEAPQRNKVKIPWQRGFIYRILKTDTYYTGIQIYEWGDEVFELPYPPIVTKEVAAIVDSLRNKRKAHPIRNVKHNYMLSGLIYCKSCNIKLGSRAVYDLTYYRCYYDKDGHHFNGCCQSMRSDPIDNLVWQEVVRLLQDGALENAIEDRIREIRQQEFNAQEEVEKIQKILDEITMERQWVITQARKRAITESDMEYQLAAITLQEKNLEQELFEAKLVLQNNSDNLINMIKIFRQDVWFGLESLNEKPETEEEENGQFQVKRKIVESLVNRIYVLADKSIEIQFIINLSNYGEDKSTSLWSHSLEFTVFSSVS